MSLTSIYGGIHPPHGGTTTNLRANRRQFRSDRARRGVGELQQTPNGPNQGGQERVQNCMTKLDKPLKRELQVKQDAYVVTIDPSGFKLTKKGRRKGIEIAWADLLNGEAAMATALNASLGRV